MEQIKPITREEVIGKRIRFVLQLDLPYDKVKEFQERLIIIEIESGLRFSLEQESQIIDHATGFGLVYPYFGSPDFYPEIDSRKEPRLQSPIKALMSPFSYVYCCGVILENGFVIYGGYSMSDNGVLFLASDPHLLSLMPTFELPSANSGQGERTRGQS